MEIIKMHLLVALVIRVCSAATIMAIIVEQGPSLIMLVLLVILMGLGMVATLPWNIVANLQVKAKVLWYVLHMVNSVLRLGTLSFKIPTE